MNTSTNTSAAVHDTGKAYTQRRKKARWKMVEQGSTTKDEDTQTELLRIEDLPPWRVDNEFILTGYRPTTRSFRKSLMSTFAIHNETINIHSHLFGCLMFIFLPLYTYYMLWRKYSTTTAVDIVVFVLYYLGVAVCFFFSSTFHMVCNHSEKVASVGNQLDYLGIVILQWGATIPTVYYGFYYERTLRIVYWSVVSALALICAVVTLHPKFASPTMRPYRAVLYACLGGSAIVFIIHGIAIHGLAVQNRRMSLQWMAVMAGFNLIGATIYAIRIPEKFMPIKFDIYGSSHQIFHFMVIFAGLAHTVGLFWAFQHIHTTLGNT